MPANKRYRFHPEALQEFEAADDWYAERNLEASLGFLSAVNDTLEHIVAAPQRWPRYLYGTRRCVLQRFPFSVVYLDDPDLIHIVAVAHAKRRPGYWRQRV